MKLPVIRWNELTPSEQNYSIRRLSQIRTPEFSDKVREIINAVKKNKDSAVCDFTEKFDRVNISSLRVTPNEFQDAYQKIASPTLLALKEAIRRISLFHAAQVPKTIQMETSPGILCERRFTPINRVGLYIPGGTAPLPSTVIMLGVPSALAGSKLRILSTPPQRDQSIDPVILVAADLLGIQDVYKAGGAQAIAAMAYGTETIPKVDKIFGPGNAWVTEAKLQISQDPDGATCDLPAGPSEVMVIADQDSNSAFIAADLLSQAEHGSDSQVVLISNSKKIIQLALKELNLQMRDLPRKKIIAESLEKSLIIEVDEIEEAISICNSYAPEHLILHINQAREFSVRIENAGSIFIGQWSPESVGDYASGTNHVLPTYGFAKSIGGLCTESFMKSVTIQELSKEGLRNIAPTVEELARVERLEAHRNAVRIRLSNFQETNPL